jgi:hypothetical protein
MAGEDERGSARRRRLQLDRRVRPVLGEPLLMGKSRKGSRQLGGRLELRATLSSTQVKDLEDC